jgi:hypothetical protein
MVYNHSYGALDYLIGVSYEAKYEDKAICDECSCAGYPHCGSGVSLPRESFAKSGER